MEHLYVLINLAILAGPFALSFDRKVAFFRRWGPWVLAILPVSVTYIVWDVIVTDIGHWWFNETYSGTFKIAGLPIGEILFFITVPYACLFIFEVAVAYFKPRRFGSVRIARIVGLMIASGAIVVAVIFRDQGYTFAVMLSIAALSLISTAIDPSMWLERHTWLYFMLSYIPFLLANGVLTALPIVGYNPDAIWGFRVYTIPIEDFFYNLGMLGFYLLGYRLLRSRTERRAERRAERS